MKKFLAVALSVVISGAMLFAGCGMFNKSVNGRDGVDGKDVSIYEIWEATNSARKEEGLEELTFLEFVEQYLGYEGGEVEEFTSLQSRINQSMRSSLAIYSRFESRSGRYITYSGASGSGVIWEMDAESETAYVVTNCHVVYDGTYAKNVYLFTYGSDVILYDYFYGTNFEIVDNDMQGVISAEIVCTAAQYDIAVLKVSGDEYKKLAATDATAVSRIYESDTVYVGEAVYTVGNQNGDGLVATHGIISRDSEYINVALTEDENDKGNSYRVMRTDAAVNGGASGGGIFNGKGELIGIVNAKSSSSSDEDVGYALPIYDVRAVVTNMLSHYKQSNNIENGIYVAKLGVSYNRKGSYNYNTETDKLEIIEDISINAVDYASPFRGKLYQNDKINQVTVLDIDGNEVASGKVTRSYILPTVLLYVQSGYTVKLNVTDAISLEEREVSYTYTQGDLQYYI